LNWLRQFMQRMNDIGGASHWRTVEAPTQVARRTT
jgi:hypothetical protein